MLLRDVIRMYKTTRYIYDVAGTNHFTDLVGHIGLDLLIRLEMEYLHGLTTIRIQMLNGILLFQSVFMFHHRQLQIVPHFLFLTKRRRVPHIILRVKCV